MKKAFFLLATFILFSLSISFINAKEVPNLEQLDNLRIEKIKKYNEAGFPDPESILKESEVLLKKPLKDQTIKELKDLARRANWFANLIGQIKSKYTDYYNSNLRYDFVLNSVSGYHDNYSNKINIFLGIRNQCYFNIGLKYKEKGDLASAYAFFYDAFRLSSFVEPEGDHKGLRYKSEIEMKKILKIENVSTYIFWK